MTCSTAFTLLLAGVVLVSQVFSRPVLLVVFDSVNASFISARMPKLDKGGDIGKLIARPAVLKSENPTKPFPLLHTLATGVLPNVHGVINNFMFNERGNTIFNKKEQFDLNIRLKPLWTEAVLNGKNTATYMWPGSDFLMRNVKPIVTKPYTGDYYEETVKTKDSNKPETRLWSWESRIPEITKWFQTEGIELGMAYFEDSNLIESVDSYIDRVYETIQKIHEELKDLDVDIIIMSSHGKKNIYKNDILIMNFYAKPCTLSGECQFFASGGVSFMKFKKKEKLDDIYTYLKMVDLDGNGKVDYGTKFKMFKREEAGMAEWNLKDSARLDNTLFFVAINGHSFFHQQTMWNMEANGLSRVRVDGYPKSDVDMNGMLLLIGDSFKDNVVTGAEIKLTEVYQLIKKLLGLKKKASSVQSVEDLSDEMKELIEPATLSAWVSSESIASEIVDKIKNFGKKENI